MDAKTSHEERSARDRHVPVLLERCVNLLEPALSGQRPVVIDATLGMGGHTEHLLQRFPALTVIGIDRDAQAHRLAGERLKRFGDRFQPEHAVYDQIPEIVRRRGLQGVDGVLFDLGVSSFQLDERERGFAYSFDAPLDMRMNVDDDLTAEVVVNEYDANHLRRILRNWGEEKFAGRIVQSLVEVRQDHRIVSTGELVEIIKKAVPAAAQRHSGHPAKRTFQALRIEVNHELEALEAAIPAALNSLTLGGRVVAMSYHSLEDKIVKRGMTALAVSTAPKGFPVELEEHRPEVKILTRGVENPTDEEINNNPRAASARLRAAERIRESRTAS
ncbi:16S rRNA (cytosine(1402)-N(4))-methyltransferase RsmH [Kocuria sp. HSID16901]|uniref:16S rRNA (cytosine(1402)-N(4))-methyltransferase RsmH n=1 Tax=Kocuria sp. HSID16901 TaxID=2419505 RepID=UPI000F889F9D|nr:16S rRNA (cytosine(1402)-N(4))-methyltransferase RsmH [Kocuria sp. HSID16901]RUQ20478.1 16S rRNA (cytosine(1402)-N(4))-methyltransferase RsmH [Kocuria sp. HSID16901]